MFQLTSCLGILSATTRLTFAFRAERLERETMLRNLVGPSDYRNLKQRLYPRNNNYLLLLPMKHLCPRVKPIKKQPRHHRKVDRVSSTIGQSIKAL